MPIILPCRHCKTPVVPRVMDTLSLAEFVVLGTLCDACYALQEDARSHVEEHP